MKRFLFVLLPLLYIVSPIAIAQESSRIEAEKVAFFTRELDLSVSDAEKFWPVYNDYSHRKEKLTQDRNALLKYVNQNFTNMSDDEMEDSGNKIVQFAVDDASLTKEYHERFKTVLTPEKVIQLYTAEIQFKKFLLNQLQERRNQGPSGSDIRR